MSTGIISLRPFIGAENYDISKKFYTALGFSEIPISENMTLFKVNDSLGFYLQKAYVKDWIDNTMLFLEVESVSEYWLFVEKLTLTETFNTVKIKPIVTLPWGKEFFIHDPSGVLWHIGEFNN